VKIRETYITNTQTDTFAANTDGNIYHQQIKSVVVAMKVTDPMHFAAMLLLLLL